MINIGSANMIASRLHFIIANGVLMYDNAVQNFIVLGDGLQCQYTPWFDERAWTKFRYQDMYLIVGKAGM